MHKNTSMRPQTQKSLKLKQQKPKNKKIKHTLTKQKRSISFGLEAPDIVNASEVELPPISRRSLTRWDKRNPYANDTMAEEDKPKISGFLTPLGLTSYIDKFTSFDQVLMTQSSILESEFGMSVKERRMLRRKANHFRVGYYYKTGEIYQPKYPHRPGISPIRFSRDLSSDDELNFVLPAEEGLYRARLRYPGSSYQGNTILQSWRDHRAFNGGKIKLDEGEKKHIEEMFGQMNQRIPDHLMGDDSIEYSGSTSDDV